MSSSNFQEPIIGRNVFAGTHVSSGSTVNYNFATPQPDQAGKLQGERNACLQSLTFPNIETRQNNIVDAHAHTCDWLFETTEFRQWKNRDNLPANNGVLWIKGKPGVGKSTLMKHTLHHCEDIFHDHLIVAYFFNARGDILEKTPQGLWRSTVYQLLKSDAYLFESFVPTFQDLQRAYGEGFEWQQSQLKTFIISAIKKWKPKPIIFFIDALDECSQDEVRDVVDFLESLSIAAVQTGSILRICLSSRHYPNITIKKTLELIVENKIGHDRDIALYVKEKLRIYDTNIEARVLNKANGVFMWVVLIIPLLNKAYDEGQMEAIQKALEEVPDNLETLFTGLLRNEDDGIKTETILMLQWVLLSYRPLTPKELFIVAVRGGVLPANDVIERRITSSSNGLIEIRRGDPDSVQFIHLSVNDFLFRNKRLQRLDQTLGPEPISATHGRLWAFCWSYIEQLDIESVEGAQSLINDPFLKYAVTGLLKHADAALSGKVQKPRFQLWKAFSKTRDVSTHQDIVKRMIRKHETWFPRWKMIVCAKSFRERYYPQMEIHENDKLLHIFTLDNCQNLLRTLLFEKQIDVNETGGTYRYALQAAAVRGNETIVRLLLEKGADVNAQDGGIGGNALQAAADRGSEAIVRLLVEKGADINAQGGHYGNALQAAAGRGRESIVRLLIEKGANINAQGGGIGGNALQAAAIGGSEAIVRLLLEKGANINAQGSKYSSALQATARSGNEDIIRLLLEKGANVNAQGGKYSSALQAAARSGNKDIIRLLLEKGANVNAQGGRYSSALQAAARSGNEDIVRLLLEEGANVNAQGGRYGSALQAAAASGNKDIIRLLLKEGADINAQGGTFGNALQAAAGHSHKAIVRLLLEKGININTQGGIHGNALQAAAISQDGEAIVRLLLEKGADINAQGGHYGNALQAAAGRGRESIVRLLLEKGADINAQGGGIGGNALQAAAGRGSEAIVRLLVEKGADINAQGGEDGSALQAAHNMGHEEIVELLLNMGADSSLLHTVNGG